MSEVVMHAVVRTDDMYATLNTTGNVSVRFYNGDKEAAIDNGNVVKIGKIEDGSREVYKAEAPTSSTPLKEVALITTPEVMYDERKRNLYEFTNEAGAISRAFYLHEHDNFSVTKEALTFTTEPKVGDIVELADGTKFSVVTSKSGATVVGHIDAVEVAGIYTYYVIKVD